MISDLPPGVLDKPNPMLYYAGIASDAIIGLWPMNETSGTVMRNIRGPAANGVHVGATPAGYNSKGRPYFSYDASGDYSNFYSAALNTAFNGQLFSAVLKLRPTAAALADGATHYAAHLFVDASNEFRIYKTTANVIACRYEGTNVVDNVDTTISTEALHTIGVTIDLAANVTGEMKVYQNGAQVGTTQTVLGVWVGALSATDCVLGATSTGATAGWLGGLSIFALYNRVLTAAEMLRWAL